MEQFAHMINNDIDNAKDEQLKSDLEKKLSVGEDYDLYNSSCKARCV